MNLSNQLINFIHLHEQDDIHSLALQAKQFPDIDIHIAIRQISGRRIAKEKIPSWYVNDRIIYPKHLSMEQCSSEQTARYKRSICKGRAMVDLTGGFGVDCSFISSGFEEATYVEHQEELAELVAYNYTILEQEKIKVVSSDAIDYLTSMSPVDLIYIDPARRDDTGRKTVLIEDCTPNILEIETLLEEKALQVMIKLSPMLDISLAVKSLKRVSDVYIISVGNECKELLFIKKKSQEKTSYHCVNIHHEKLEQFTFYKEEEESIVLGYTSQVDKYLYEPNASILKAGAYKSIAKEFTLNKLHPSSHLYTSDILYDGFQGRKFIVEAICSLNKKDLKMYLKDIKQANITTRNFPLSVQEIRKKTGLRDGGDAYIFATTLADEKRVLIICKKA
ncbi:SAM-dependent methyltransferase [Dysgonomonas sp. Marseille-P4677]|uniref:THUMP-like domain-containing protein n=1 Tax=Dysgonomonas sp. Marseille-P4677 TaxID=2364790 RepID=UPI001914A30F|nr:SAM-dependent methyltransferase [Dysgonomonas sp. Marseille-P4677]MBK5721955.1 SAM-dependent methyltransferase [Dysgonomonas sp. Marseille-P4677]